MRVLQQITAVVSMNILSLPQRYATSLVIVVGIAGVVAVLISVLSLSTGLQHTLAATGRFDRALILHAQSLDEVGSSLSRESVLTILDAPGIARGPDGKPIASAEMLATINLPRRDNGQLGTLTLRGVSDQVLALRPELHLTGGRMFRAGLHEVIAGRATQDRFRGLDIGRRIQFGPNEWTVVGTFSSGGGAHDSELFADADTVLSAYQRTTFNSVTVQLAGADGFERLSKALSGDPTLSVLVRRESQYYEQQSQSFSRLLTLIAHVVGTVMAIGAVFAALNTMYSAVASRAVEIATLRAIGFGSVPVLLSVLAESLLLAIIGAALGAAVAWLLFNGDTVSTLAGGTSLAQVVFHLHIGLALIVVGILWACVVGLIGGLLPAIRAARLPVASALRAV
jgi:putative ABC transport system permease protein